MTTQDRRIISAEEARNLLDNKAWVAHMSETPLDLTHTVVVQAEQIAAVLALHTPVSVNKFDHKNGTFVYGEDGELIVTHRLCEGCTLDSTLEALGDCEWSEDHEGSVYYPCPTARALGVSGE